MPPISPSAARVDAPADTITADVEAAITRAFGPADELAARAVERYAGEVAASARRQWPAAVADALRAEQ